MPGGGSHGKKKGGRGDRGDLGEYAQWLKGSSRTRPDWISAHMIARFLGVRVWELDKVAAHYQDEAAVILMAQDEARAAQRNADFKAGAMAAGIVIAES